MNKVVIITGQTATGKTALALDYAQKYDGEIINCDSRQIYKYLNIITGKDLSEISNFNTFDKLSVDPEQSRGIKSQDFTKIKKLYLNFDIGYHTLQTKNYKPPTKIWLYDIVKPDQYFSSFDYQQCALWVIKKILSKGRTPIIVGGTYLYIKHLLYDIETENIPPDWKLRKKLANKSVKELQIILRKISPKLADSLNHSEINNPQRLIRKIEITMNVPINQLIGTYMKKAASKAHLRLEDKLKLGKIEIDFRGLRFKKRENLRSAIEKRVEERLQKGALAEVKGILKMGYKRSDPGLRSIGYKELLLHLKGGSDIDTAIQSWITKETQYAKRQYTFMKKDKNIQWTLV